MVKPASKGFTIVEVLVVIVVIGILAAVTIVAFTNITQKAAGVTLEYDLKNASTQLGVDKASNGSYPTSIDEANNGNGLSKSSGTDYQYTTITDGYCLSATSNAAGSLTYHISSDVGKIESGVCSGHTEPDVGGGTTPTGVPPAGDGLAFDGQDDYVRIPSSSSLNITNNLTLEAWVYPSSVAADDDWRTLIGKLEAGTGGYEIGVDVDQSALYFVVQLASGVVATGYNFPTLDTWYHVVATYQAGPIMKLYVNGVLVEDTPQTYGSEPFSGNIATSSKPLYIGGDPTDSSYCPREFYGEVDEVRIYNRILSEIEVGEHYAATFANESNLVGMWHFDEGSGVTIADSSGNGNHGAIIAPVSGGYAMSFNGNGDYITVPDSNSLDLTGEFTIEGWVKRDSVSQLSDYRLIIGKTNSSYPTSVYGWITDTDFGGMISCTNTEGECSIGFFQNTNGAFMASTPGFMNEWHYFATTYNYPANRETIYLDYDSNGSTSPWANIAASDGVLYIGGNGSRSGIAPYDFAGDLDEIRIYGKELPSNIVRAHLLGDFSQDATGCGGASCDLRAHWAFNEGSGGTLVDLSGNGNNGVISGNPQWVSTQSGAQRETH